MAQQYSQADIDNAARTIIGEALGEGPEGMAAVAGVIFNRARRDGKSLTDIVSKKGQFAGYTNPGSATKKAMADPAIMAEARRIVAGVAAGTIDPGIGNADHFHSTGASPDWSRKIPKVGTVGKHIFYASGKVPPVAPRAPIPATLSPELAAQRRAGLSAASRYNPNVGIGDTGNAAMSVTSRVPTANFRNPADPTLNNVSPEQAKLLSRGLDMNVSREQSAKDVLIGGFGALLGKPFPMGSASAAPTALRSVSRPTYVVDSSGNIVDRTTGAKVGQSEPSFANADLSALRRQIGITDASRVAPAVPAAAPKPTLPKLTGFGGMTGTSLPRPASFPVTTKTVRSDGTVVSGVGGAGQVGTGKLPEDYSPNRQPKPATTTPKVAYSGDPSLGNIYVYPKVPYTEGDPNRLKPQPKGLPLNTPTKFVVPYYASASPSLAAQPVKTAAAPIPLPRNARPVAPAGNALAAAENLAGLQPPSRNVSSYSGGSSGSSSSSGGYSSPAPIKGSSTGKLYNVGQTYTTGGGLKYVAQADGSFKKV